LFDITSICKSQLHLYFSLEYAFRHVYENQDKLELNVSHQFLICADSVRSQFLLLKIKNDVLVGSDKVIFRRKLVRFPLNVSSLSENENWYSRLCGSLGNCQPIYMCHAPKEHNTNFLHYNNSTLHYILYSEEGGFISLRNVGICLSKHLDSRPSRICIFFILG
jgi:hypothetical protein